MAPASASAERRLFIRRAGETAKALEPSKTKLCALHFPAVAPMVMPPRTLEGQANVYGPPDAGWQIIKLSHCPGCAFESVDEVTSAVSVSSKVLPSPASNEAVPLDSATETNPAVIP